MFYFFLGYSNIEKVINTSEIIRNVVKCLAFEHFSDEVENDELMNTHTFDYIIEIVRDDDKP